jgi:glycosyltransferase involved in cell wall biosynthesis
MPPRKNQELSIDYNYELIPRGAARENLNLVSEFTIIWVGRVVPVKNPKLLVEVARLMPDCKFLLAGDGIELDHIKSVKPNNLEILGFIDVREILLAGDLFLSTSLNEGIPYSILEAQSAGLPVVAVNAGALAEIVTHGHNGFLVAADLNEIVNQIRKLQYNPELLEEIMIKTKEGLSSKSVSLDFTQSHLQIYKELLEGH